MSTKELTDERIAELNLLDEILDSMFAPSEIYISASWAGIDVGTILKKGQRNYHVVGFSEHSCQMKCGGFVDTKFSTTDLSRFITLLAEAKPFEQELKEISKELSEITSFPSHHKRPLHSMTLTVTRQWVTTQAE